jgi:hypothetical protein
MQPMMWMGRLSGIGAFAMGALFAGFAAVQLSWGVVSWPLMLAAALLMTGSYRTLNGKSGGLRLLCGAWGFAAGISLPMSGVLEPASDGYATVNMIAGLMIIVVPIISLGGLALTVLHRERY